MTSTIWPFGAGFIACAIIVPYLIQWQHGRHLGQQIYEDGPKSHAAKQGTPTLGGLAFIAAAALGLIFTSGANDAKLFVLAAGAGAIGAADDFIILFRRRALGLKARWKFALLALLAVGYLYWLQSGTAPLGYGEVWFGTIGLVLPSWIWWVLSLCAIVGAANAVNLTDGVDGLATGTALAPLLLFGLAALSSVTLAVLGACVAFLWFNRHPAKIFMGDAGSLLLGALLAGAAIQSGLLLLLPLVGLVYVVEALSVMAQVVSFKLTGKRIFKMSPLHHHFELSGWNERWITAMFVTASVVMTLAVMVAIIATKNFIGPDVLPPGGLRPSP
ncbi:MAG TPA: phospho-N-acetylmuramoyl-pentapeptide-transferase [Candidatus Eremiobacteraceae bacterium]|nr:phospho-N-acetylmuramoyl-pentapeptide-transferase [Candidatus Eremiobacteraceae bacterium]